MLQDKDQQIQELITEGEKLSKKELKHNNIVKKLREKEKENEKTMETQRFLTQKFYVSRFFFK